MLHSYALIYIYIAFDPLIITTRWRRGVSEYVTDTVCSNVCLCASAHANRHQSFHLPSCELFALSLWSSLTRDNLSRVYRQRADRPIISAKGDLHLRVGGAQVAGAGNPGVRYHRADGEA